VVGLKKNFDFKHPMYSLKRKSYEYIVPNFFYRKKECYECELKHHKLFLRESYNYIELVCKSCLNYETTYRDLKSNKFSKKKNKIVF